MLTLSEPPSVCLRSMGMSVKVCRMRLKGEGGVKANGACTTSSLLAQAVRDRTRDTKPS